MKRYHELFNFRSAFRILSKGRVVLAITAFLSGATIAFASPTGGVVTTGNASINHSGTTTTITQSTNKASINWQSFNVRSNETVNFKQPSVSAIALNRVIGNDGSTIAGHINANGQIFLLNPNGILFTKTSQVNTAGIVASTLNISDANFQKGDYTLSGSSTNSVINNGNINTTGYAALIAKSVINNGTITATLGTVQLAAGSKVTLNLEGNSLVSLTINQGTYNALVKNKGIIKADGGSIYLTSKGLNKVLNGVVNNTGIIQAQGIGTKDGHIVLYAHGGEMQAGGTIDTGKGRGSVETSGEQFTTLDALHVTTGHWLIDPVDITIDSTLASSIDSALGSGDVTISTDGSNTPDTSSGETSPTANGDITVNAPMNWSANTLTLSAGDSINLNAQMDLTNTAGLALDYAQASGSSGTYNVNAPINIASTGSFSTQQGTNAAINYNIINDASALQNINSNLSGDYVLGSNIVLPAADSTGNNFTPIGNDSTKFTGVFDGLGHTIDKLTENSSNDYVGLFGDANGFIKNVGVTNESITSTGLSVGGLAGFNNGGTITNSYATGSVTGGGSSHAGGLVGVNYNNGTITNSYATVSVVTGGGNGYTAGGLVGWDEGSISDSYATGSVKGSSTVGGLVGYNRGGSITNSYATGDVTGSDKVGGLVGDNEECSISDSYATGSVTSTGDQSNVGGLVGYSYYSTISDSYAIGDVTGSGKVGGLVGQNYNYSGSITNNYATGSVTDTGNSSFIGGLVGWAAGSISDSYATGSVTGGGNGNSAGGLVGWAAGSISDSYATGSVTGGNYSFVGGLVGYNKTVAISNSYATGSVTGSNYTGGLVGYNEGSISDSYATGDVTGSDNVGGLVGYSSGSISSSFWDITTSGQTSSAGGTGLTDTEMANSSNFSSWDSSIWSFLDPDPSVEGYQAGGYPYLTNVTQSSDIHKVILFSGGYGTSTSPYTLTNWQQLQNINYDAHTLTSNYQLLNNLGTTTSGYTAYASSTANSGAGFTPIGNSSTKFSGIFDGLGHTIDKLTKNSSDDAGLFGYTGSGSTIKNIGVTNENITGSGYAYIGGLVGNNDGTITNSYATGSVTGGSNIYVGGLVGYNRGTITNSYATGSVTSTGGGKVGGLVGYSSGSISDSYATGDIVGETGRMTLGGLVGYNDGTITNSHATGNITGTEAGVGPIDEVGGLVGWNYGTITNSYATGSVTSDLTVNEDDSYVGGLVGWNEGSISDSYATGDVAAGIDSIAGGLMGENYNGTVTNSYATGSVTNMGSNDSNLGGSGNSSAGGLIGENYNGTITNSYATGVVIGGVSTGWWYNYIGGLVGYNHGNIKNSYATGSVTGGSNSHVGGLLGGNNNGTITNSFWDTEKSGQSSSAGGTPLTTQQMEYGQTFKNAGWDISANPSLTPGAPTLTMNSSGTIWQIAPLVLSYTLNSKSFAYDGTDKYISSFNDSPTDIFGDNYGIQSGDYGFSVNGAFVSSYKHAGVHGNIRVKPKNDFLTIKSSGNTDGTLTINSKSITVSGETIADKIYNGTTDASFSNYGTLNSGDIISGDTVTIDNSASTATFASKDVANNIAVTTDYKLGGAQANDYTVTQPTSLTADITPKTLALSATKMYDGTTDLTGDVIISNLVNSETLNYSDATAYSKYIGTGNYINNITLTDGTGLVSNYRLPVLNSTNAPVVIHNNSAINQLIAPIDNKAVTSAPPQNNKYALGVPAAPNFKVMVSDGGVKLPQGVKPFSNANQGDK